MRCPFCDYRRTLVIDSRGVNEGRVTRRRRECEKCRARFSTQEKVEILKLTVLKRNGRGEEYDKRKIIRSLRIATNKRMSENKLSDLIIDVEREIFALRKRRLSTKDIGKIILRRLKKSDEVSYLRYVSVFKSFGSGSRFAKELKKI